MGPLRLFGHCMGAVVAFEFARVAERHGVEVRRAVGVGRSGPVDGRGVTSRCRPPRRDVLADMVDLGGTDPRLLDDEDFVELLADGGAAPTIAR